MQDKIDLVRATRKDAKLLHRLQVEAFMPLYEKYHDDDLSPAKESEERLLKKIEDTNWDFYIIYDEKVSVGGIRVSHHRGKAVIENVEWISPLFVIPEFQNRGIAQLVIGKVFELCPETMAWRLDTIKQEPGNCHLYEKCGFIKTGADEMVNDWMTFINYEKTCVEVRRLDG